MSPGSVIRRALSTRPPGPAPALPPPAPAAAATAGPPPASMASMGDSIPRAFNACGFYVDCPSRSFSTGGYTPVNSQATRITAKNSALAGHVFNDARSGAVAADMPGQAATAVSQHVQYVTILIGGNDACTSSEATMTSVAAFRASIDNTPPTLKSGLPTSPAEPVSTP